MVLMSSVHHRFLDAVHASESLVDICFNWESKVICDDLAKFFSGLIQIELNCL